MNITQKADFILSDLSTNGGLLTVDQSNRFIRTLQEQPTMLGKVRTVPMNSPSMEINKIKFGSRVMQPASQDAAASTAVFDGRNLTEAARAKPTTSKVTLNTVEVMTEMRVRYEMLEDNIERDQLTNTMLTLLADRVALDFEDLLLNGDTTSGDAWLALRDGALKQATAHTSDAASNPLTANYLINTIKELPKQYRDDKSKVGYFVASDAEVDYRNALATRQTGYGDALLVGDQPLSVGGYKLQSAHRMPDASGLYCDPRNIIFGIQRNITMEGDKFIRSRELIFVMTARIDIKIEETDAIVKLTNIG